MDHSDFYATRFLDAIIIINTKFYCYKQAPMQLFFTFTLTFAMCSMLLLSHSTWTFGRREFWSRTLPIFLFHTHFYGILRKFTWHTQDTVIDCEKGNRKQHSTKYEYKIQWKCFRCAEVRFCSCMCTVGRRENYVNNVKSCPRLGQLNIFNCTMHVWQTLIRKKNVKYVCNCVSI